MQEVNSSRKKSKLCISRLPDITSLPINLSNIDPTVAKLLRKVSQNVSKAAADAARESTFTYLQSDDPDTCSLYTSIYAAAQLYYAEACLIESTAKTLVDDAKECIRAVDLALLRGGLEKWGKFGRQLIQRAEAMLPELPVHDIPEPVRTKNNTLPPQYLTDAKCEDIMRVDARELTMEQFRDVYMCASLPVILTHAIDAWPAMKRWSTSYLKQKASHRLVPVETYASQDATQTYLSSSWEQRVMTLGDYIDNYVEGGDADERGYLAQYQLFDQIPSLMNDILIPEYCAAFTEEDTAAPPYIEVRSDPLVSSWFGPAGTVSPLHNDPYQNLLAQVVGSKYIRLYDISQTGHVYPRDGPLCNNSLVDLDHIDEEAFPLITNAKSRQCVLQAGEVLYIPRHCWHYVRSLETSFSVSFWFGAKMALEHVEGGTFRSMY